MPIPMNAKNVLLHDRPGIISALDNLRESPREQGVRRQLPPDFTNRGPRIPDGSHHGSKHLQGIAVVGSRVFLTTSAGYGKIISARRGANGDYFVDREAVGFDRSCHPGGIQAIGHYLVIPIYGDGYSAIEIRDIRTEELPVVKRFRMGRKAYCVGIATARDGQGEYYLLAAVTGSGGMRVEFYRTPSELRLTDPGCFFELLRVFETQRRPENPARDWNGYPNNMSLLADENGHVYFLGLYKSEILGGQDWADLYHVNLDADEPKTFRRLSRFHAKCNSAPAFRWGGGTTVVDDATIMIYACERNVQDHNSRIRLDFFEA